MKKIALILTALLTLASCIKEDITPVGTVDSENVVLDFSVVVPEAPVATKTMSDPGIGNLAVFVFDENGILLKAVSATPKEGNWGLGTTEFDFTATLPQHPSKCHVHFVANCPLQTLPTEGLEMDIMTGMTTSGAADAYWQRVEVPNLIASNAELKSALVDNYFTAIPLIRNFAKVTVELGSEVSGFTMLGYTLINVPTSGTVVPYNTNTGVFEPYNEEGTGLNYAELKGRDYNGFMPSGVYYNETIPTDVTNKASVYTYESKLRESNNTALIVYGTYNGTDGYYKVDFVSASNNHNNGNYEILRNLHYVVTIENVVGAGYASAAAAAAAVAGNNISASTDTQNLLNISDGTSRLSVDQITKHIVSSDAFTLKYKYEATIGTPSDQTATITRSKATADADAVISAMSGPVYGGDGWSTITITPKTPPTTVGTVYTEELTIKVGNLSRTVKLYLHQPYTMTVACTPTSATSLKTAVTVSTTIPAGLPEEIFPLEFEIEDTQLCLSPDVSKTDLQGSIPVTMNPSIIPLNTKTTFHYIRTLTKAQYDAITASGETITFNTYFLTNKTTVSGIKVYVRSELFGTKSN